MASSMSSQLFASVLWFKIRRRLLTGGEEEYLARVVLV